MYHMLKGMEEFVVACSRATLPVDMPTEKLYYDSRYGYKTANGTLTIAQGNNVIEKQGSGFILLNTLTQNSTITATATVANVTLYVFKDAKGASNAQLVEVTNNVTLPERCYAVIADGVFNVTSANTIVNIGNTQIQLTNNQSLSLEANEFVSLTTINNQTVLSGNGSIIILTRVE